MNYTFDEYKSHWEGKTEQQLEKEISSWRKHMAKHSAAYQWHGENLTAPGELSDGTRLCILKDVLREKQKCKP